MHYIIVNGTRLKGKKRKTLQKVCEVFESRNIQYEVRCTEYAGHAKQITAEITSDGQENVIVAVGGDGTLHEVINGFVDFEKNSLALIPFGTGNDFAATANIPKNCVKAAALIADGTPKKIDFIQLSTGLRSINAVGTGLDVDVLKRVYGKERTGKLKYLFSLIACLTHFKSYDFTIEYNGVKEERHGLIAAVGNGRQIGGGIKICPEAKIDDGYFDLLIVDFISRFKTIFAFLKLMRGKINKIKQVTAVKAKEVTINMHSQYYTIQAEGELYDNLPFEAKIEPAKLKFYLPEK